MIKGVFTEKDFQTVGLLYATTITRHYKNSSMEYNLFQIERGYFDQTSSDTLPSMN